MLIENFNTAKYSILAEVTFKLGKKDMIRKIRKIYLIRKIWFFSKFMTSQPGQQTITIHILPNITRR